MRRHPGIKGLGPGEGAGQKRMDRHAHKLYIPRSQALNISVVLRGASALKPKLPLWKRLRGRKAVKGLVGPEPESSENSTTQQAIRHKAGNSFRLRECWAGGGLALNPKP